MGLKTYKPTTPGLRARISDDFKDITRIEPEKSLIKSFKKRAGRNNAGKVTVRHRGGGVKRYYRIIDFKRDKFDIPGRVVSIEYDPNRSARISLVQYTDGEKRYILTPLELRVGDSVISGTSGNNIEIKPGNSLPLKYIPVGTPVHNIELQIGKGGQLIRSAGTSAQFMSKEGSYSLIRLASGEIRRIHVNCRATIGQMGNVDHQNIVLGKAGRARHLGLRPEVRGAVMSPRAHPHGGGEGKNSRGMPPKTPWGKPALGYRTRRRKISNKFIVKRRD